ncbi:MAG: MFS transporter, partial [Actinobacteria bacterium]|nr:MFS transporter [Actinomycetota bacterium]
AEAARLAGPCLGGGLVGLVGAATTMAADAVSFAVSVASLVLIRARPAAPQPAPRVRLRTEVTAGLAFVFREPILRKVVACTGTCNLFSGVTSALEIIFLVRVLHVAPAYTGLVVALSAVGGIAGGTVSGWLARMIGSARIIWVSILGFGVVGLLIPFATPGWGVALFVLGWAGFSFSAVVYNVAQVSYRQAVCPPELLGRMNAAVRWVVWGTIPLGGLLGGALGSALGVRAALVVGVAGTWAGGLWVFFSPLRRMRDVPPPGTYPGVPPPGPQPAATPEPAPEP